MSEAPKEELWICYRKIHTPEHDGATGYFYYEGVRPVEPSITLRELKALVEGMKGQVRAPREYTHGYSSGYMSGANTALTDLYEAAEKGRG